jgi:hypothetical protein
MTHSVREPFHGLAAMEGASDWRALSLSDICLPWLASMPSVVGAGTEGPSTALRIAQGQRQLVAQVRDIFYAHRQADQAVADA